MSSMISRAVWLILVIIWVDLVIFNRVFHFFIINVLIKIFTSVKILVLIGTDTTGRDKNVDATLFYWCYVNLNDP